MTEEALSLVGLQLTLLTELQKQFHLTEPNKNDEDIISRFDSTRYTQKTNLAIPYRRKLTIVNNNNKTEESDLQEDIVLTEIEYKHFKELHRLISTFVSISIPKISVKEKWRNKVEIAWPYKLAHHILQTVNLLIDNDEVNGNMNFLDSVWLDFLRIYQEKKPKFYDKLIGNVPEMTNWNTVLPNYPIILLQPFSFSKHLGYSLPLHLCKTNKISQTYIFKLNIKNLIKIRIRKDEQSEWVISDMASQAAGEYIDGPLEIPTPNIWGEYGQLSQDEINADQEDPVIMYVDDIISKDVEIPLSLGEHIEIPLESATPVKAIFWVVENQDSEKQHNFGNYTTNQENLLKGINPCIKYTLTFKGRNRISSESGTMSENMIKLNYGLNDLEEYGYNMIPLSFQPFSQMERCGSVLDLYDVQLRLTLGNSNKENNLTFDKGTETEDIPYELRSSSKKITSTKEKYKIKIRLLVSKKVTFKYGEKPLIEHNSIPIIIKE